MNFISRSSKGPGGRSKPARTRTLLILYRIGRKPYWIWSEIGPRETYFGTLKSRRAWAHHLAQFSAQVWRWRVIETSASWTEAWTTWRSVR